MNKQEAILATINWLGEFINTKGKDLHYYQEGLCNNVDEVLFISNYTSYNIIEEHFKTWKYFSGCIDYPVPTTDKRLKSSDPLWQYHSSRKRGDLYSGKQLQMRLSLAEHLIKELKKELITYANR